MVKSCDAIGVKESVSGFCNTRKDRGDTRKRAAPMNVECLNIVLVLMRSNLESNENDHVEVPLFYYFLSVLLFVD